MNRCTVAHPDLTLRGFPNTAGLAESADGNGLAEGAVEIA